MFRFNRQVNIDREARNAFRYVESIYHQIKIINKKHFYSPCTSTYSFFNGLINFSITTNYDRIHDNSPRYALIENQYDILESYLQNIASKNQGMAVLAKLQQIITTKIDAINDNYTEPFHQVSFYNSVMSIISKVISLNSQIFDKNLSPKDQLIEQYYQARKRRGSV